MLKLINAGLCMTGSPSLQAALEQLGFGLCHCMSELVDSEERLALWEEIIHGKRRPDWEAVFDGYSAAVDGPSAIYYRQIAQAFPEAKVVLTVRDAEQWYQATYDTLYQFALKRGQSRRAVPPDVQARNSRLHSLADAVAWNGLFGGHFSERAYAIEVYRDRNHAVVCNIDRRNLLVYDVKQGWGPLCAFLGVDVPVQAFPYVDETESWRKALGRY